MLIFACVSLIPIGSLCSAGLYSMPIASEKGRVALCCKHSFMQGFRTSEGQPFLNCFVAPLGTTQGFY